MDVYLKKIELHGFKSFPEKVIIQLHKGITVIIGPNGCGKSNLVDAILWVLGEQRIKNLRGEENQDLIFSGSASKKPLGMTEVGMFIANKEEETYIARRFFRNGEGKYILNEKFCRNKDIQDMLFDLGIGEKAYYIFEQGSVEKMVSLKPIERRILIEEAAGIAQYLEKKKETASKLIISQQNLDNLEIIILEKGKRLKELKNQAHYVQRYRSAKNQRADFLKALLQKKYRRFKEDFDAVGTKIEKEISQEAVLAKSISDAEESLLKLEQDRWEQERGLKNSQQQLYQVNSRILGGQKELEKVQQRIGFLEQRRDELKKSNESGSGEISTLEERGRVIGDEVSQHESQLQANEERMGLKKEEFCGMQEAISALEKQEQELKKSWFQIESEAAAAGNLIGQLEKNAMRLENGISGKKHLLAELEIQAKPAEIHDLEGGLASLAAELRDREEGFRDADREYQAVLSEIKAKEDLLHKQALEIEYLENRRNQYEKIKDSIKGAAPGAEPLASDGALQDGIHAGKANRRLLENFYYEEMDAPILRDAADALKPGITKAVLKRQAADEFSPEIREEPGFKCFIKDLFSLEKRELQDFFKNAVVAADLRCGLAIFFKYGVHVVTEDAEVITRDGLLIRNRERGILDVMEEIKEGGKRIDDLRADFQKSEARLKVEKEKETASQAKRKERQEEWEAANKKVIALQSQLDLLKKNQQLSIDRIQINRAETQALEGELQKVKDELAAAKAKKELLEKNRQELAGRREKLGAEINRRQKELAEIEKAMVSEEHLLALAREKRQSASQFAQDVLSQKQKLVRQLQSADKEIEATAAEIRQLAGRIGGLQHEEQEGGKQKTDLENKIKDDELRLNSLDQQIKEIQAQLADRRNVRDELRERKKELEIAIGGLKKDLFQLEEVSAQELNMELKDIEVDEQLLVETLPALEEQVAQLTDRVNKMRDNERLNFSAEAEMGILEKDYDFLLTQKEDVLKSIQDMHAAIQRIDNESKESFIKAFTSIRDNFIANFKILFEGGEADLELTMPDDLLESGLEIKAQPPGKRLQSIRLLSGGEKTLTSLAFLFGLFQYKPSPFCVFDEVDASLDEANIQRFLNFLHQLKEKTQFVIITHNFKTMEKADYIYGISMDEPGISKIYSMKMN